MQTFHGLSGALGQTLPGFMTNPFGSPQFGLEQQMGTRQAQNLGQTGTSNLLRNMTTSGMFGGASSPAGLEMLQNQGRANTGLQANLGFLAPYMAALNRQQYAMGIGAGYRPLQTGQTQQEKTGGLGTWLPQVAQLGIGAAMAPFTGGMSLMGPMSSMMGGGGGGLFGGGGGGGWAGGGGGGFSDPASSGGGDPYYNPNVPTTWKP